jgi:hypothetical protein
LAPQWPLVFLGAQISVVLSFLSPHREASAQSKVRGTDGKLTTELDQKRDLKLALPVTYLDD